LNELFPLLPRGPALDLACGTGRNTLFLAQRQPVTAVDRSEAALEILEKRARQARLAVSHGFRIAPAGKGLHLVAADLEASGLPRDAYSVIVCIRYLQRSLFRAIEGALAPGGALLFETYTEAQLEFAEGPKNPEYLLHTGELRAAFPGLETVFYRELNAGIGIASLLAKKRVTA
jgi:SAM-dependent methyltransferase